MAAEEIQKPVSKGLGSRLVTDNCGQSANGNAGTPQRFLLCHGRIRKFGGRAAEPEADVAMVSETVSTARCNLAKRAHKRGARAAAIVASNAVLLSKEPSCGKTPKIERIQQNAATASLRKITVAPAPLNSGDECVVKERVVEAELDSSEDKNGCASVMYVDEEGLEHVSSRVFGRSQQGTAVRKLALIAKEASGNLKAARKSNKRVATTVIDEEGLEKQVVEDERVDGVAEIRRMMGREDRADERWYLVCWCHVEAGEHECDWVPEDAVKGASAWKSVVDRYYDQILPKNPDLLFVHYIEQGLRVITMSASCVCSAIDKLMELKESHMQMTMDMIAEFELEKGIDRIAQKGLSTNQVNMLFDFLVRRGFKNHMYHNQYKGKGSGPVGLAMAAKDPGLYSVGTFEEPRIAHCFILEITEEMSCFVHEFGVKIRLGQYKYAHQIRWVRRCRPTDKVDVVDRDESIELEEGAEKSTKSMSSFKKSKRRRKRVRKTPIVDLTAATAN